MHRDPYGCHALPRLQDKRAETRQDHTLSIRRNGSRFPPSWLHQTLVCSTFQPISRQLARFGNQQQRTNLAITNKQVCVTSSLPNIFSTKHPLYQASSLPSIFTTKHLLYQTSSLPNIFSTKHLLYQASSPPNIFSTKHLHHQTSSVLQARLLNHILFTLLRTFVRRLGVIPCRNRASSSLGSRS